jgi:hypothetical protein
MTVENAAPLEPFVANPVSDSILSYPSLGLYLFLVGFWSGARRVRDDILRSSPAGDRSRPRESFPERRRST